MMMKYIVRVYDISVASNMARVIERKNHIYNKKPMKKAQENFGDGRTSSSKRSDLFCEHYKIIGHSKEKCLDGSSGILSNEVVEE